MLIFIAIHSFTIVIVLYILVFDSLTYSKKSLVVRILYWPDFSLECEIKLIINKE